MTTLTRPARRWGAAAVLALGVAAALLGAALVWLHQPWLLALALWYVGAWLLWFAAAPRPLRSPLVQQPHTPVARTLLVSFGLALGWGLIEAAIRWAGGEYRLPSAAESADRLLPALVGALLAGVVMNALPEELTLRGAALTIVRGWVPGVAAVVLTGAIFGLLHLPSVLATAPDPLTIAWVVGSRAAFGAAWGWATIRCGSVAVGLGLHAGTNLVSVFASNWAIPLTSATWVGPPLLEVTAAAGQLALVWVALRACGVTWRDGRPQRP